MTMLVEDESYCSEASSDGVVAYEDVYREKNALVTTETRPLSRPTNVGSTNDQTFFRDSNTASQYNGGKRQTYYVTHSMNSAKNFRNLRKSLPVFGTGGGGKHKKTQSLSFAVNQKRSMFDSIDSSKKEDPYMTLNQENIFTEADEKDVITPALRSSS